MTEKELEIWVEERMEKGERKYFSFPPESKDLLLAGYEAALWDRAEELELRKPNIKYMGEDEYGHDQYSIDQFPPPKRSKG